MAFEVRRVVTGHDEEGTAVFRSDGPPPLTVDAPGGYGVSELLWLDGPVRSYDDGVDRTGDGFPLEPPPGGASVRIVRLPPPAPDASPDDRWLRVAGDDPAEPGMHATDTLDVVAVLHGSIALGLDDGEHELHRGDVVLQRGNRHRWRVVGDEPCTYAVFMFRPDPDATPPEAEIDVPSSGSDAVGPRRLVAGADDDGRSHVVADGTAALVFAPSGADGSVLTDLVQTGGPLLAADQGGDPVGPWALEPVGGGIAVRMVELPSERDPTGGFWHATETIDVDIMIDGRIEMDLPDLPPVELGPGDCVVQRGTNHRWRPVGDERVRFIAAMLAVPPGAPD
jgi:quercetin dioxygenase-like cupin family protein